MASHFDYPEDDISEVEVFRELDAAHLQYKDGYKYILSQCPLHEDRNPSVQIFKADWWVNCMAGCGRFHITKAFPALRSTTHGASSYQKRYDTHEPKLNSTQTLRTARKENKVQKEYKKMDLMEYWKGLKPIPEGTTFKTMDAEHLNSLGWRVEEGGMGVGTGWFIPYFDSNKQTIPFGQVRHHSGPVRFHFAKDLEPRVYGTWNIEPGTIFIVEGCSDGAVLDYCNTPWVALPSASSGTLLKKMAAHCHSIGAQLVYAGDNDDAGDKLRQALDEIGIPHRVKQPPKKYKDWGDFLEAEGQLAVINWTHAELRHEIISWRPSTSEMGDQEAKIIGLMGGGQVLERST